VGVDAELDRLVGFGRSQCALSPATRWNTILYNGTVPSLPTHDSFAAVGNYGLSTITGWAGTVPRGIYLFEAPAIIRNDHPGTRVESATLTLHLGYFDQGPGHLDAIGGAPGAHAYQFETADHSLGGVIVANDYFAIERQDLGLIVPATGIFIVPASGDYSIDITSALQVAVDHPAWGELFAVRLHFGGETLASGDPLGITDTLFFAYFFETNVPARRTPG